MTLGATFADAIGGWAQGCLVLLIFVWLFLALLGIRNGRFPKRLVGGVAFVLGSALWIGLHPSLAEAWNLDAGWLGWRAQLRIAGPLAGSAFALNAIGAILLLSSLVGFLIAIDWLPLLPLAPMLARLDARMGAGFGAGGEDAASPSKTGARPLTWLRSAAAATLEREPKARLVSPAPKASAPAAATPIPAPAAPPAAPPTTAIADEPAIAGAVAHEIEETEGPAHDASEPARTDWNRFRPRAKPLIEERSEDDLTVDIASDGSHNSSAPAGESRASTGIAEPSGTTPEGKDPPVLDPDQTEEHPLELSALATRGSDSATSVADDEEVGEEQEPLESTELAAPPADATAEAAVEQAVEETIEEIVEETEVAEELGPRRKKEEEPAEEPAEEPDEGEEDDEKGDDDEEFDEEEEDEDEEFEEEEEEDEDWEEDEEEEEEKEGEEGEEDEKEDDEDWEEDDEGEDDEDDDEDDDKDDDEDEKDEEEKDENWDDDKGAAPAGPAASSEPAILEVDASIPESAALVEPSEESPELAAREAEPVASESEPAEPDVEAAAPEVEVLTPKAEAPAPAPAAAELPADLFRDLATDERQLLARAVDAILGLESVSLSRIQRELGITYYAAARVFERLEKEGFIAPYSGSLARAVVVTREQWEERRRRST